MRLRTSVLALVIACFLFGGNALADRVDLSEFIDRDAQASFKSKPSTKAEPAKATKKSNKRVASAPRGKKKLSKAKLQPRKKVTAKQRRR